MGNFWSYLTVTYNAWFTAPLAVVFLFAIFRLVLGGLDFGDGDVDADVDADVDFDVDADVDFDVDADVDFDVDADVDVDVDVDADIDMDVDADVDADTAIVADSGASGNAFVDVFGFLNVGRVPFMIVMMTLFTTWGFTGLIVNQILGVNSAPSMFFWVSCAAALVCSVLGTRYLSLTLSKVFPESDPATKDLHLLGLRGRVVSGQVTTTFGTARVVVPNGDTLTVKCRIKPDEPKPVKGDTVILVNYDSEKRMFDVKPVEVELS
ncbi:MAG: DUF1449 family protein [Candidatus Poribacteria bacterium]|nr:DUF1449 family protein [Candidatus Poribacteria bacterium]